MVNWGNAILVAVLGLATVFAVLIIIMLALMLMTKIFAPKGSSQPKTEEKPIEVKKVTPAPQENLQQSKDDSELIAVLAAAISASLNTSTYNLKIKSYRRLGEAKTSWGSIARKENIYTKF